MREVILNDECAHCNDKECHNGEHFCNQAMKENSFYKNAKLYKGFEVIQRPTYEELEKENAELKSNFRICEKNADTYYDNLTNAKDIIEKLRALYLSPVVTKDDVKRQDEILAEAEQFLNTEVKK